MALRKIIQVEGEAFVSTSFGQVSIGPQKTAFSAYCKIIHLTCNKSTGQATVQCADENCKTTFQYSIPLSVEDNAPNFVKQAYLHLKTMPEWADAIDC